MTLKFHVFGDSHARYFFTRPRIRMRMDLPPHAFEVEGKAIGAASVAGFRPGRSTLSTKEKIARASKDAERIVLGFGQVDLELGYYYRNVVKGERVDPETYVDWLAGIYDGFLDDLPASKIKFALKGVNLTVLTEEGFAVRYVERIIKPQRDDTEQHAALLKQLEKDILSAADQDRMHLAFNARIKESAERRGMAYFDVNRDICRRDAEGRPAPELGLDPIWMPRANDHHLVDSLAAYDVHLMRMFEAFELPYPKNRPASVDERAA